jgi:hypothetical protein
MHTTIANRLTGTTHVSTAPHPLTHHEILGLVAPFARSGRHVDLAESDRIKRSLAFKPIEHVSEDHVLAGVCETLQLDNPRPDYYRLTRNLTLPSGLNATLQTEGPDPCDLLARIETVPPQRQFRSESGVIIALSHRLTPTADAGQDDMLSMQLVFTRAEAHFEGLTLLLNDSIVKNYPAKIELVPDVSYDFELTEDLLAVLGRDWGILRKRRAGWTSTLWVRGKAFDRCRQIESKLERLVAHLTTTLSRPPLHFHETLRRARWRVALWRASPMLVFFALIAGILGLSHVEVPQNSVMRLLPAMMPALLMIGAFSMRDRPPIEIPSFPRRLRATAWRQPPAAHQVPAHQAQ